MPVHKALVLHRKDAGRFDLEDRPTPKPGPGQLLIKLYAAALNPIDVNIQKYGHVVEHYGFPAVAGNDGAGTVEEIGEGVEGWAKGDRVLVQGYWFADRGMLQQYTLGDAVRTAKIPQNMTFEQASTIPLALGTASIGLYHGPVKIPGFPGRMGGISLTPPWEEGGLNKYAGQPILVVGGSSSVGQLAIQLAKLSGFDPIITTASKHNEAYCKAAGATHVIDYHNTPYAELQSVIAKITTAPFNVVFDAIAVQDSQTACWRVLAPGGSLIVTLPALVEEGKEGDGGKRVTFMYGNINAPETQEFGAKMYKALPKLLEQGSIKPNNVEVCGDGLAGAYDGLERLARGVSGVKLVVRPNIS